MNTTPLLLQEENLSYTWRKAMECTIESSPHEITPLILTLTNFDENSSIREALDSHLQQNGLASVQTVSETIFPDSLYQFLGQQRSDLYDEYLKNLPRIKKIDPSNRNGTYFERLIAFEGKDKKINQLEIIISSLKNKNIRRRSKLQASIFDPEKDHTNKPFQGFPCLQHVTFFQSTNGGLVMNSFYAVQYLYRRAYGNWLGLINLGKFVANELEIELERFTCYVGVEHLDHLSKTQAQGLLAKLYN
jgi:thymidylate synthase